MMAQEQQEVPREDPSVKERNDYDQQVKTFADFLQAKRDYWEKTIDTTLANERYRIPVEMSDLDRHEPGLSDRLLKAPVKFIVPWEEALLGFIREINEKWLKQMTQPLKIDIRGSFGRNHQTPRGLTSVLLGQLVCVEGIITKAGLNVPKLIQSIHVRKDADDGKVTSRDHRDVTALVVRSSGQGMPNKDDEGHELMMETGLSCYKDIQKFHIQEGPDQTPAGQIPRHVEVIVQGDLVDQAKPGDRVQVTGVYRSFPPRPQDFTNGIWPARLIATNVTLIKQMLEPSYVSEDISNVKQIAQRPDAFQLLARSFAPAICGHEKVKEGLLLQMVGGTEKNLANGTHLRGDINVLLIGDPSCGKSQMLRFVMNVSELAVSTTGRGSSGAGLTAAMIRDAATREFHLEAGAMVLADRGTICIDEFDKMSENDRVAIHEAMEQQCVTIAKAGMHVTLNARCRVVAAANPIYGSFDADQSLSKNIGMPDSLLSRFDLIYVVRDNTTEEIDRKIATQVLRQAASRPKNDGLRRGVEQVHSSILERRKQVEKTSQEATEVFEKQTQGPSGENRPDILTVDFLKKYIRYCKRFTPVLTEAAQVEVADRYVDLRMRWQSGQAHPDSQRKPKLAVTTRTLEAIIRLATAHAKLKLQKHHVREEDVKAAYELMLAAREEEDPPADEAEPVEAAPGDEGPGAPGPAASGRKRKRRGSEPAEAAASEAAAGSQEDAGAGAAIQPGRRKVLAHLVARTFARQGVPEMQFAELRETVNAALAEGEDIFLEDEFRAGMDRLEAENKVMLTEEGLVFFVS